MPIMLPLTMIGFGYLIYLLFAGATMALPIALGVFAGFGAHQLGVAPLTAIILGFLAFMAVLTASKVAALKLASPYTRIALALLFAVPAALTGFSLARALGVLLGTTGIVFGLVGAAACAAIAAKRALHPAI